MRMWVCLLFFSLYLVSVFSYNLNFDHLDYPLSVPLVERRRDPHSGDLVTSGRFELLDGFPDKPVRKNTQKVSTNDFKKILQCLPSESKYERTGALNLMKYIPPTSEIIEQIAAWCETGCTPWAKCHTVVEDFKKGNYPPTVEGINLMSNGSPFQIKILRILNGKLYLDWPWGRQRIRVPYASITNPLLYLTNTISDLPDLFFFIGVEMPWLPSQYPIPAFSNSPSFLTGDLPFPWYSPLNIQIQTYRAVAEKFPHNFTLENILSSSQYGEDIKWEEKINKCAYYGALTENRQIFYHLAQTRPDLFDIGWTSDYLGVHDWNPLSFQNSLRLNSETIKQHEEMRSNSSSSSSFSHGYNVNLLKSSLKSGVNFVKRYRYVVVLTGLNGNALSGSLNNLLTQSGAVLLLQSSPFLYHYSSHLKPWIHYVPLSETADDVIEKVEWLQNHPNIAKRIAHNGRVFGQSYLRLEDYFCYFVNIFQSIAQRLNQTEESRLATTQPFNPIEIEPKFDRWL